MAAMAAVTSRVAMLMRTAAAAAARAEPAVMAAREWRG